MNQKTIVAGLLILSGLTASLQAAAAQENTALRIYLPREMTIESSTPTLGQVAILRGSETVTAQAGQITLGHLSVPDQNLVINRKFILSRLACNGIDTAEVSLTGAEEVTVQRRHQSITSDEFVAQATDFLKSHLPDKTICQLNPIRLPKSLITSGSDQALNLSCEIVGLQGNQCKVRTTASRDGQAIASRDTIFLCQYKCRKAVAKTTIEKGQMLNAENIRIQEVVSKTPQPANWTPPYGLIAKRTFAANAEIPAHLVAAATPPVLLKRNQTVTIMINRAGFVATATGTALQDGATGEYIKVKNVDSQKIIMAKVIEDGTVEPIF